MKTKITLTLFTMLFPLMSFAQWGVKGGVDFSSSYSTYSYSSDAKYQPGFNIGAIYDVKLSNKMYFQPGLLFVTNGLNFKTSALIKKIQVSMYALEVPLVMSFRPNFGSDRFKLITDFGLYTRYGLFGQNKVEFPDKESTSTPSFDDYQRFDMGLNVGVGLSYYNYGLVVTYQLGFTDIEKGVNGLKHEKIRISFIYNFY